MRLLRFIGMIAVLIFIFFVLPINEWMSKPSGELTVSTMWEDTKDSVQDIDIEEIGDRMKSTANRVQFFFSSLMDDESSIQFQEMPRHESTEQGKNKKPEIKLTEADIQEFEYEVLELANEERKAQGLEPLEFSVEVSEVAPSEIS